MSDCGEVSALAPKVDKLKAYVVGFSFNFFWQCAKTELMARALRAKLRFNDSSHPERGRWSHYRGRSAKTADILSWSIIVVFTASTCASINNNSVNKLHECKWSQWAEPSSHGV